MIKELVRRALQSGQIYCSEDGQVLLHQSSENRQTVLLHQIEDDVDGTVKRQNLVEGDFTSVETSRRVTKEGEGGALLSKMKEEVNPSTTTITPTTTKECRALKNPLPSPASSLVWPGWVVGKFTCSGGDGGEKLKPSGARHLLKSPSSSSALPPQQSPWWPCPEDRSGENKPQTDKTQHGKDPLQNEDLAMVGDILKYEFEDELSKQGMMPPSYDESTNSKRKIRQGDLEEKSVFENPPEEEGSRWKEEGKNEPRNNNSTSLTRTPSFLVNFRDTLEVSIYYFKKSLYF